MPRAPHASWRASSIELCPIYKCGVLSAPNATATSPLNKTGTVTGTAGYGSSLFLHRVTIPAPMALSEIDVAMSIRFNATNNGAGTLSRSMAIYSFGNSTSLNTLLSASGSSTWTTGTSTVLGSTSISQFQQGWSNGFQIIPMTFASSWINPGEYVVGQIFNFDQLAGASTWTVGMFQPLWYSAGLISRYLASAVSAFSASSSSALTAFSGPITVASALSSGGLVAVSAYTGTGSVAAISNSGTLAINNYELSSNTFVGSAASAIASATAISTKSFSIQSRTAFSAAVTAANAMASTVLSAGSFVATSGSVGAISNSVTSAFAGFMGSGGLVAGSLPTSSSLQRGAAAEALSIAYLGTADVTTGSYQGPFLFGSSSTGAIPATVAVRDAQSSSQAANIPWFALIGA